MRQSSLLAGSILLTTALVAAAQESNKKSNAAAEQEQQKLAAAVLAAEQHTFAVTQLISLADEARSYSDMALRPRVLSQVADLIWDADRESARRMFRRAWDAAEAADAEELSKKIEDPQLQMVAALRRAGGMDSRNEVLRVVARRDHALGEEFLAKLKAKDKEGGDFANRKSNPEDLERRLQAARSLLEKDQVEQALAFAGPGLMQVSKGSIGFLCALRSKRAGAADQIFVSLTSLAEFDPAADANTVSLLSSYTFTPGYYMTFNTQGYGSWSFEDGPHTPFELPPAVHAAFFKVAAAILLRPLLPPDQDTTTSGRAGKYMVISRLMPQFEKYAPDTATALRSQLASLKAETPKNRMPDPNRMSPPPNEDSTAKPSSTDIIDRMQEKLDHAGTSRERDTICAYAAADLADQGDARARDVADKIDDSEKRNKIRRYVDFQLVRFALRKKDLNEALRLARKGELTHAERAWTYNQAIKLLPKTEKASAIDLLEKALIEAQRIEAGDPDRARALFATATQMFDFDSARAWEIVTDAVKSANGTERFSGERASIGSGPAILRSGATFEMTSDEDAGVSNILRLLAKDDLNRSMGIAKSFKQERPRALAVLAVAATALEKPVVSNR